MLPKRNVIDKIFAGYTLAPMRWRTDAREQMIGWIIHSVGRLARIGNRVKRDVYIIKSAISVIDDIKISRGRRIERHEFDALPLIVTIGKKGGRSNRELADEAFP